MSELQQMYQKAIEHYNKQKQLNKTMEELDELFEEVCLSRIGVDNRNKIIEESADVLNMIAQLQLIFSISDDELQQEMRRKMERTMKRIDEEIKNKD